MARRGGGDDWGFRRGYWGFRRGDWSFQRRIRVGDASGSRVHQGDGTQEEGDADYRKRDLKCQCSFSRVLEREGLNSLNN